MPSNPRRALKPKATEVEEEEVSDSIEGKKGTSKKSGSSPATRSTDDLTSKSGKIRFDKANRAVQSNQVAPEQSAKIVVQVTFNQTEYEVHDSGLRCYGLNNVDFAYRDLQWTVPDCLRNTSPDKAADSKYSKDTSAMHVRFKVLHSTHCDVEIGTGTFDVRAFLKGDNPTCTSPTRQQQQQLFKSQLSVLSETSESASCAKLTQKGNAERSNSETFYLVDLVDANGIRAGTLFFYAVLKPPGTLQLTVRMARQLKDVQQIYEAEHLVNYEKRTFVASLVLLLLYLIIGISFYSQVSGAIQHSDSNETVSTGTKVTNGLYFTVVTLTTVGYGDLGPVTPGTRLFTVFFVLIGIGFIGVSLGIVAAKLLDMNGKALAAVVDELDGDDDNCPIAAVAPTAHHAETTQKRAETETLGRIDSATNGLEPSSRISSASFELGTKQKPKKKSSHTKLRKSKKDRMPSKVKSVARGKSVRLQAEAHAAWSMQSYSFWSSPEFEALKQFLQLLIVIFIGTIFHVLESDKTFVDGLYFATISCTTVGYGDESPSSNFGKIFVSFYLLIAVVIVGRALGSLANLPLSWRQQKLKAQLLSIFGANLSLDELGALCQQFGSVPGRCARNDFVLGMLLKAGTLSDDDVAQAARNFDTLDTDSSGVLSAVDLSINEEDLHEQLRGLSKAEQKTVIAFRMAEMTSVVRREDQVLKDQIASAKKERERLKQQLERYEESVTDQVLERLRSVDNFKGFSEQLKSVQELAPLKEERSGSLSMFADV